MFQPTSQPASHGPPNFLAQQLQTLGRGGDPAGFPRWNEGTGSARSRNAQGLPCISGWGAQGEGTKLLGTPRTTVGSAAPALPSVPFPSARAWPHWG